MATAYNTTVKVYKGIPLVKGGTEVLYLSGASAEAQLTAGAEDVKTYSQYYYTRENRRAIQIDAPIQDLEGYNYVGFQNASHGGKWYFGFIDEVVYINDNNTEIHFTTDPFTTFLGDAKQLSDCYIIRNTDKFDIPRTNLQADYMPDTTKKSFTPLSNGDASYYLDTSAVYFCAGNVTAPEIGQTGIKVGKLTDANLKAILENGGTIIGAYMFPSAWAGSYGANAVLLGTLSGNPFAHASGYRHEKIRSGVYNKVVLQTPVGNRSYDPEQFDTPTNVEFQLVRLLMPCPSVFVYPKNYNGVVDNIAEGILVKFPAIPISANAVYTNAEKTSDLWSIINSTLMGGINGARSGGVPGAILGAGFNAVGGYANARMKDIMTRYEAPFVQMVSDPGITADGYIRISLSCSHPYASDLERIDKYMDYYGYQMNTSLATGYTINTEDKAFLQTGDDLLVGSEADMELNARLMSGIKIRTQLT